MENFAYINQRPPLTQHWAVPILSAIVLLPMLIWLLWKNQKVEFEDRHEQLIADTLWAEQSMRNRLQHDEDDMFRLAQDIAADRVPPGQLSRHIGDKISVLLQKRPEITSVTWLDTADGTSTLTTKDARHEAQLRHAGTPVYAQPLGTDQHGAIDYYQPIFRSDRYIGSIVARYDLTQLLDQVVPWWFAKDNAISILDINDKVVAQREAGGSGHNVFVHTKSLDLPGLDLVLKTDSSKDAPRLFSKFLAGTVVVLALGLCWSLWALRRDTLRRQTAETALRRQIAFRDAMENSLVTGLLVRNLRGQLAYVNPSFCTMVGYTKKQLIGQQMPFSFWTLDAYEQFCADAQELDRSDHSDGLETMYQHVNGRRIPVLVHESALLDDNGLQIGSMSAVLDISERKRSEQILRDSEERLQRSSRLATMGELTSVMAHELNQPLTAITTYSSGILSMMQDAMPDRDTLEPALTTVQQQAHRAAQIVRSLHDFVVKREPYRVSVPCTDLFITVLPLIELQAKSYLINLKTRIDDDLPDVLVDPISLEQVMLNLTRNAMQSMQALTMQKREIQIHAFREDDMVQIEVIDNGTGIDKQVAERLFSPFFSTKAEGMGMGLNICRTIVEFHGGQLTHRPDPSGGTIFSFTVPIAKKSVAPIECAS